ncbi:MarR family winged helix-turn-helix transcriptional regulator [Desulfitobacterium metallireducens]|uniref:MarR family transcriptional regulator n=1 Tax=Desulfitobacterium metallireducens DSM 15288 TaxID=871968 RepID=W0EEL4_9FIRM|nr:MarR family transcriptional regulator [Desulfitobacterium metallireducens]AHF07649.1 MarR family transcriptional regulator [Desulfitobacterium metallireducens DSM 15288]
MNSENAKEIYDLLLNFMGLFYEKIFLRSRHDSCNLPCLKKNQMKILSILYQHEHITLTEIGKMLNIEKGSLTTLVDGLVENNFVIRSNDLNDRRKSLISLSPSGIEVTDKVIKFYSQKVTELLRDVDSKETQQFLESLQFVVKFMKKI